MIQILISVIGLSVVYRILSLLEKFEVLNRSKRLLFHVLLQLPFIYLAIFKEHLTFVLLYIGIISLILIAIRKIIALFREKQFEQLHLVLIQRVLMHISRGNSASTALHSAINSFPERDKIVFLCERDANNNESSFDFCEIDDFRHRTMKELRKILNQNVHVVPQLLMLRQFLSLRNNLRHRSRQLLLQSRAQACVCIIIYGFFWHLSVNKLNFNLNSPLAIISPLMFTVGLIILFQLGGGFKWKT